MLRGLNRAVVQRDVALRRITGAGDGVDPGRGDHVLRGHLIARQRAGLVAADHGDGTKRLDRRQAPDDDLASRHALHADCQCDGDDGRQAFGDGRDRECHGGKKHVLAVQVVQKHADREGERGQRQYRYGQLPAEAFQFAEQGRGERLDRGQQAADAADLGVRAGGDHHADALAVRHQRTGVGHAAAIAEWRIHCGAQGGFFHRFGFAGQRRLIDAQRAGLQQAQLGRHLVAVGDQDNIARHKLFGRYLDHAPVAPHSRLQRQQVADRVHGALGLAFLYETDHGVDDHDTEDHAAVDPIAQQQSDRAGDEQNVDQDIVKLPQEPP